MTETMWMVRAGRGGRYADDFVENNIVAIGWEKASDLGAFQDKQQIMEMLQSVSPGLKPGKYQSSASQLIRFRDVLQEGDRVITYDSSRRIYHVGSITGKYRHEPDLLPPLVNVRAVKWDGEVQRDRLSTATRNTLGSTLTLFKVAEFAMREIEALLAGSYVTPEPDEEAEEEDEENLLDRYKEEAFEIIKDRVNRLDWEQMQELVAGVLRGMGYQTRVSPRGPDRGVDVMASPDGFGFKPPRIMVEVKHRGQAMGAQEIRSFLGGRHKDDKGLYVSTSGFTKEARYEAERANIPVTLMDIDDLVNAILSHYEDMDMDARNLLPLKKIYWPV